MATNPIYGSLNSGGVNQFGFKAQSVQDNNQMANFLQSSENSASAAGAQNRAAGTNTFATGTEAFGPVLSYLTKLTQGDQADVAQATQGQTNQIKDSFAAARAMISGQPRGGGKAGALAEAPFQQARAVGDMQSGARQGAVGQLGTVAGSLAGLGINEQTAGLASQQMALSTALEQRGQNEQERAATQKMISDLAGAAGGAYATYKHG